MECPYCGNTKRFTDPVPLCSWSPPELGTVPQIQKCRKCDATLSLEAFLRGTEKHTKARERYGR